MKSIVTGGGKHRESSSRYELYAEEHEDQIPQAKNINT
jgi:hypothetical protein